MLHNYVFVAITDNKKDVGAIMIILMMYFRTKFNNNILFNELFLEFIGKVINVI